MKYLLSTTALALVLTFSPAMADTDVSMETSVNTSTTAAAGHSGDSKEKINAVRNSLKQEVSIDPETGELVIDGEVGVDTTVEDQIDERDPALDIDDMTSTAQEDTPEMDIDADTSMDTDIESETDMDSQTDADAEMETDNTVDAETDIEVQTDTESDGDSRIRLGADPEADIDADVDADTDSDIDVDAETDSMDSLAPEAGIPAEKEKGLWQTIKGYFN